MLRIALFVLSFTICAAGCSRRQYHVESVVRGRDGKIWVTGTDGLAGYFTKTGFIRADYHCGRRDFRGAYHTYMDMPASQLALHGGEPYLFTRRGEVSRWSQGGWRSLKVRLPSTTGSEYPQINVVFKAPDGRLLIQIHSEVLVWATQSEMESGGFTQERTPTYFTSLAFVDGTLYGIGYRDSGNVQVLRRREGPESWPEVARLPGDIQNDSYLGIIDWGSRTAALVTSQGVYVPSNGEMVMVTIPDLLRRAGRQGPELSPASATVARVVRVSGGPSLLQLHGTPPTGGLLAVFDQQTLAFWPCGLPPLAGGIHFDNKTWVVARDGAIYELGDGQCPMVHGAVVRQ